MKENCNSSESGSEKYVISNNLSEKNNQPSSFESKMINKKNMSGVMLSLLKPEERTKLFFLNKHIRKKLSEVECMRKDKLYADYLHCISNDNKKLKKIINNIFESDLKQLNKKLEKSDEEIQTRFHFDKEKKEIMACMQPYLKIYICKIILAEIFSLTRDDFNANSVSSDDEISKCIGDNKK